jgi:phage-related protein (TIGR01555 family)
MPNTMNGTEYTMERLTQNYTLLITLYRNNWMVKKIIDLIAEDMTKAWINITSDITPEAQDAIDKFERNAKVRAKITEGLKWGRLFGGAAGLMMIDGMDEDSLMEPLNLDTVMPGSFKGIMIVDRWSGVYPEIDLVDDIGDPEFGEPEFYEISDFARKTSYFVHHSHLLLFKGRPLPAWEEMSTQMWGASEVEALYDEIKKRDNTSANIAGLIFRTNINVQKMAGLGQLLGLGDEEAQKDLYAALSAQNELMNNFSTYVMDADDDFQSIQNTTFSGLNDIYESFMMDVCGATDIPMTKLFGRAPAGLSATGEGDLQNYYDVIADKQEAQLRPILEKLLPVMFMSIFGQVPDDIQFRFNSPRTPNEKDIADLVAKKVEAITSTYTAGLITQKIGMKELQAMGQTTGMFTNITDEDIEKADDELDQGDMPGITPPFMQGGDNTPDDKEPLDKRPPKGIPPKGGQQAGATKDADPFKESDHPRDDDGKFGSGGISNETSKKMLDKGTAKRYSDVLLNYTTHDGVVIKRLADHAITRGTERDVSPEKVKDILKNYTASYPGNVKNRRVYVKDKVRVIVDYTDGAIVSIVKEEYDDE